MGNIIKQNRLRPLCHKILEREISPIPYKELADLVIKEQGEYNGYDLRKIKEDIREKILIAGLDDTGYTGKPYFLAYKKRWVKRNQAVFNFNEPIKVPMTVSSSTAGACETVFRFKHMLYKPTMEKLTIDEAIDKAPNVINFRIKRSIIENNVSDYFKNRWPNLWIPPSNEKIYELPAPDDFRMRIRGDDHIYLFDVCTPDKHNLIGKVNMKKEAHIHVVANDENDGINIIGFTTGKLFKEKQWVIEELYPIHQLIFWLNCVSKNYPYNIFN
jgi:hypothetical protein